MALEFGGRLFDKNIKDSTGANATGISSVGEFGTIITKIKDAINSTSTIYTVTTGKTLYITSMWLVWRNRSTPSANQSVKIAANSIEVLNMEFSFTKEDHGEIAVSLPTPLIVLSGDTITVISPNTQTVATAGFTGYEL